MLYGKKANHVRYIKQVANDISKMDNPLEWIYYPGGERRPNYNHPDYKKLLKSGYFSKRSKVVSYWDTFDYPLLMQIIAIVLGLIALYITIKSMAN